MDRPSKQIIKKEMMAFNDTLEQMDLTDTFRTFHPKTTEYTLFLSAHGSFSRIGHLLAHKTSLTKFKIKVIPCIFSGHKAMKLEVNHKRKSGKTTNT